MSAPDAQPYAAFRLNFEQQQKRAKDLLKAANDGDVSALRRLQHAGFASAPYKLAQAQHCIARELRFTNWGALKRHIARMDATRAGLGTILDGDCRTLHIRCGHDIQQTLRDAGFRGDFYAHINPYLEGPVVDAPDWLERRAQFIAEGFGFYSSMDYASALAGLQQEEKRLHDASRSYDRAMLWFEHDRYDQFVLLRCLAFFAEHGPPARLEMLRINDYPGSTRFVGLGQLPPEALQLLWAQRAEVTPAQLQFAREAWHMFRAPDPRPLAQLMRNGTPLLPDLAGALHRHLQELPSPANGLGLTQCLLLQALADHGPQRAGRLVGRLMHTCDPLPGLGDISHDQVLRALAAVAEPLVQRSGANAPQQWHLDEIELTAAGREVLDGRRNWLDVVQVERWVGGVRIAAGQHNWHWDDSEKAVILI
ncbi:MAG: DUF1835 domain-containing protein [Gammaproteobacteria bacterium]